MSTGTTTPADLYRKALEDDAAVAADQARLKADIGVDTFDHDQLATLVASYGKPVIVIDPDGINAVILVAENSQIVTTAAVVGTAPPPTPTP